MEHDHVKVTPGALRTASEKIGANVADFRKTYQKLLDTVRASSGWAGIDALEFINAVESYEEMFKNVMDGLDSYADLLKQCADAYVEAGNYLYEMGRKL